MKFLFVSVIFGTLITLSARQNKPDDSPQTNVPPISAENPSPAPAQTPTPVQAPAPDAPSPVDRVEVAKYIKLIEGLHLPVSYRLDRSSFNKDLVVEHLVGWRCGLQIRQMEEAPKGPGNLFHEDLVLGLCDSGKGGALEVIPDRFISKRVFKSGGWFSPGEDSLTEIVLGPNHTVEAYRTRTNSHTISNDSDGPLECEVIKSVQNNVRVDYQSTGRTKILKMTDAKRNLTYGYERSRGVQGLLYVQTYDRELTVQLAPGKTLLARQTRIKSQPNERYDFSVEKSDRNSCALTVTENTAVIFEATIPDDCFGTNLLLEDMNGVF